MVLTFSGLAASGTPMAPSIIKPHNRLMLGFMMLTINKNNDKSAPPTITVGGAPKTSAKALAGSTPSGINPNVIIKILITRPINS